MWRQLGPDGQAPYIAEHKRLLTAVHARAWEMKNLQDDCDCEAGIESELCSHIERSGSTVLQPASSQQGAIDVDVTHAACAGLTAPQPQRGNIVSSPRLVSDIGADRVAPDDGTIEPVLVGRVSRARPTSYYFPIALICGLRGEVAGQRRARHRRQGARSPHA